METFSAFKRCVMAVVVEMYAGLGMGGTQVRFLKHIARHGRISQAELARATGTDPALTGRALQSLMERGAIRRERSKTDRREYLLDLGPAGAESVAQVVRAHGLLAERLVKPLDDRDLKDFQRITKRLVEAFGIRDADVEPVPDQPAATAKPVASARNRRTPTKVKRRKQTG